MIFLIVLKHCVTPTCLFFVNCFYYTTSLPLTPSESLYAYPNGITALFNIFINSILTKLLSLSIALLNIIKEINLILSIGNDILRPYLKFDTAIIHKRSLIIKLQLKAIAKYSNQLEFPARGSFSLSFRTHSEHIFSCHSILTWLQFWRPPQRIFHSFHKNSTMGLKFQGLFSLRIPYSFYVGPI